MCNDQDRPTPTTAHGIAENRQAVSMEVN